MQEAVHGGTGQERVAEEWRPLLYVAVARDDDGALLLAVANDFVQVHGLVVEQTA